VRLKHHAYGFSVRAQGGREEEGVPDEDVYLAFEPPQKSRRLHHHAQAQDNSHS